MAKDARRTERDDGERRDTWTRTTDEHATDFARAKSPTGPRVGAIVAWLVGLALEAFGTLYATGDVRPSWMDLPPVLVAIVCAVVDVVLVLVGAALWRRAGVLAAKAKGTSKAGNAGMVRVVLSTAAFVPMVLYFAVSKNASARTRASSVIAAIVTVAALTACAVAL